LLRFRQRNREQRQTGSRLKSDFQLKASA
jgi:hypothetical protein